MHILVCGGAGFIGSAFIRNYLNNNPDSKIINLDVLTIGSNLENLKDIENNPNYKFIKDDIRNESVIDGLVKDADVVVNFAAESHVDRSIDGPSDFIRTNISGTYTLLQKSLCYYQSLTKEDQKSFRFHHVSTDEVFGSLNEDDFFTEETPYDPSSPYSASKAASDHLVRAWHRTYGLPIIISNCSNNYGPFQFPEKLIPLMVLNCLQEKPLPVYGTGENIRDWLFVDDHCDAIHKIIEKGEIGETYNVGGNNEIKNINIVKTICNLLDNIRPSENLKSYQELITFVKDRPGHDFRYAIDSSKLQNKLGWSPKETFETGIRKTIEWYLENITWWQDIQNNTYQQERLGVL